MGIWRISKRLSIPSGRTIAKRVYIFLIHFQLPPQTSSSFLFLPTGRFTKLITNCTALFPPQHRYLHMRIVLIDMELLARKPIPLEAQIVHDCNSPYISFHSAFISESCICICIEFMDKGSFGRVYKQIGPIDIDVVGKITLAMVEGLMHLYDVHRITHQDGLLITLLSTPLVPSPHCCLHRTEWVKGGQGGEAWRFVFG